MLYPKFKDLLLSGRGDLINSDVHVILTSSSYKDTDTMIDDIAVDSYYVILTDKTVVNGVFSAKNINVRVMNDVVLQGIVLYRADGTLIAYIDNIAGLPMNNILGEHSTVYIQWNTLEDKILRI